MNMIYLIHRVHMQNYLILNEISTILRMVVLKNLGIGKDIDVVGRIGSLQCADRLLVHVLELSSLLMHIR